MKINQYLSKESISTEKKHFLEPFGIHKVKPLDYSIKETKNGDKYGLIIYLTNGDEGNKEIELPSGEKTKHFVTQTNFTGWINEDYLEKFANTTRSILLKLKIVKSEDEVEKWFEQFDSYLDAMKALGEAIKKNIEWFYIRHKVNQHNGYWNAELAGFKYKNADGAKVELCLPDDVIKGSIEYTNIKNKKGYDSEVIGKLKYRFNDTEEIMKVSEKHDLKDVVRDTDEQDDDNDDLGGFADDADVTEEPDF